MRRSGIGYADYSGGVLNFITGCTSISEGCAHCYARAIYQRFGRVFGKVEVHPNKLERLRSIRFPPPYKRPGSSRPLVFVCDTGDIFHPDVSSDFIADAFRVMASRRDVDWLALTKRPERLGRILIGPTRRWYEGGEFFPNVFLGVTAENQEMAKRRIPILLEQWHSTTWVSAEPLLESISLDQLPLWIGKREDVYPDWIVVGAESGPHRRPFDVAWAEALYDQCKAAGVAFYAKQGSGFRPGKPLSIHGKKVEEWPK